MKLRLIPLFTLFAVSILGAPAQQPVSAPPVSSPDYDLLLKGGHVIDAKNGIDDVYDVAIKDGKIAKVDKNIPSNYAVKTVVLKDMYVVPGLIDIHVHVYAGTGERNSYAGDNSIYPDGFTLRVGVTTVVDAGCSGWRNFEDFKDRVIDRSQTRVLAMLNIVGHGMRGGKVENDTTDMQAEPTAAMAKEVSKHHRRNQDCPLHGARVDPRRTGGEGRDYREYSGHGRLRWQTNGTPHVSAAGREAPPRRHLHPCVLRRARRTRFQNRWARPRYAGRQGAWHLL